jgi:hypothetical protein
VRVKNALARSVPPPNVRPEGEDGDRGETVTWGRICRRSRGTRPPQILVVVDAVRLDDVQQNAYLFRETQAGKSGRRSKSKA